MEKTNIDHAKNILKDLKCHEHGTDPFNEKMKEILEFLDFAADEIKSLKDDLKKAEDDRDEFDIDLSNLKEAEPEYKHSDFVGLYTIHWLLQNGNLNIQSELESFINKLKIKNSVIPS